MCRAEFSSPGSNRGVCDTGHESGCFCYFKPDIFEDFSIFLC